MSEIKDELEEAARKAFEEGKAELVLKADELEALVAAYVDAPKPRWYVLAGFAAGLMFGAIITLAVQALR